MGDSDFEERCGALQEAWYGLGGHPVNRAYAAFIYIEQCPTDQQVPLLRHLCENWELWENVEREVPPVGTRFSNEEVEELAEKSGQVLDAMLDAEIAAHPNEDEFYEHLWTHVHNPFFSTERQRAFALHWAIIDSRVPYFRFGPGLKMSDEQLTQRLTKLYREYAKVRFLLRQPFQSTIEQADLIRQVIDEPQDQADRAILLAALTQMAYETGTQTGASQVA